MTHRGDGAQTPPAGSWAPRPVWARAEASGIDVADDSEIGFVCDAMLGGLARWLRAAGYEAYWRKDIADAEAVAEAQRRRAVLLTCDRQLVQRRAIQSGLVRCLLLPHPLRRLEQTEFVIRKLRLPLRQPRCMACGARLDEVPKESVADRAPPKAFAWCDQFFVCQGCGRLFWHGTHWQRITQQLRQIVERSHDGA